jgi:hypothetical protein
MRKKAFALIGTGLITATNAGAHHGFGNFALDVDIELSGVVTSLDFVNPHSWLHFDVTGENGVTTEHRCELRSATTLRRSGWTPEMFAAGMRITIQGSPDRADPLACYTSTLIFSDGSSLDRYGQRIPAEPAIERVARLPNGHPNLGGNWAVEQRIMTDPRGRDGTLVPLSQVGNFEPGAVPEGQNEIPGARGTPQAAQVRNSVARRPARAALGLTEAGQTAMQPLAEISRAERACLFSSIVSEWGGEPVNQITQANDTITIEYGRLGLARTIHTRMTIHPSQIEPSRAGHSIGWWDSDVLVVDTIGFLPGTLLGTTPHSERLHVVERFSLDADAMTLQREHWAEDPLYFTEAHTGSVTMMLSNVPYEAEPCVDLTPSLEPVQVR